MTVSSIERQVRFGLPIVRLMQEYLPLSMMRRLLTQSMSRVSLGAGVTRESVTADGVPHEWIIPADCAADQVVLYLHGGGFVLGLSPPHLKMAAYLAEQIGRRILMVDYRLAPEHPFPAAMDDCVTVYRRLLRQGIPARNIVVAGDSAGGNLTLALLLKLRDDGDPLPAAAACLSPVTDLTDKNKSGNGYKDPVLPSKTMRFYAESYVGSSDARMPLISPVFADLRGLPPLLIHAGEDEILREDAVRFTRQAESAGVPVRLEIYPRMWHVWQLNLMLPQAIQSLNDINRFFQVHLGEPV